MQEKVKSNSVVTHSMQDGKIVFTVRDAGKLTFDPDKVSAENRARAMIHGFVQRISDGAALSRDTTTGLSATPEAKLARMQLIADHLQSGATEWALRVAAPREDDAGLRLQGIMRGMGVDLDAAEKLVAGLATKRGIDRDAAIKIWAASDKVARAIVEIKAERTAKGATDADALLAEIDGEAG